MLKLIVVIIMGSCEIILGTVIITTLLALAKLLLRSNFEHINHRCFNSASFKKLFENKNNA